ncbi:hypothetical protein SUGI_0472560 [Cryptomeria japonica]|nr:hypothetical protein SUGI_0472520 [Cryptomeria japonica]GLJ24709.1 hypothetical protein SUGI_0472540 [Cryptomeria japonica]GLJ24710.1 hypothetical protein SUGI_0472560 [Cryptomeria japonica]
MTHKRQWDGQGITPRNLIDGIADFVRLSARLVNAPYWNKCGSGDRWDQGNEFTAYFLQYCESISSGFVLNTKLASGWDVGFLSDLTGKSVDQLWSDYKTKYGASA